MATYRFFPSDMGPRKKFEREKKWRVEMIRTTLPGCALIDKISYRFRCFRLRSSKWDSLTAHVLMKSEHIIPANQCIPLQASVHIIVYHCITKTKFDQFDWGFQFWICPSVCLSVGLPASQPACLPACVCFYVFFSKFFDTDLKIQPLLCFICHWTTVLTIDFRSLWRAKYRSHCSLTSLYWRSLPKV